MDEKYKSEIIHTVELDLKWTNATVGNRFKAFVIINKSPFQIGSYNNMTEMFDAAKLTMINALQSLNVPYRQE